MASWLGDQPEPDAYIKSCLLPMWACSMRWKWGITSSLTLAYFYILILKQQITVLHKYTNPTWFFSFLTLFANLLWTSRCFFFLNIITHLKHLSNTNEVLVFLLSLLYHSVSIVIFMLLTFNLCKENSSFSKWHFLKAFRSIKEGTSGILPNLNMVIFHFRVHGVNIFLSIKVLNAIVFQWSCRRGIEILWSHLSFRLQS